LYNKSKTTLIAYPAIKTDTYFIIPSSVTRIGEGTFQNCTSLTSITIPNSVTSIGRVAFFRTGLTSITIPNSVNSIEDEAFRGNSSLAKVIFQGTIPKANFDVNAFDGGIYSSDLKDKFYATNTSYGTPGTYTTTAPVSSSSVWTRQ